jgi:5-methylcytosine-specific restriction endonuclease McrA
LTVRPCRTCGRLVKGAFYCSRECDTSRRTSSHKWRTEIRPAVLKRDGYTCQLCGAPANAVDHIVPYRDGGTDDLSNLRALCPSCNSRRR